MNYYAAIDVSLELSSVCIVEATGKVVKEVKVETRPEALVKFFKDFGLPLTRIGPLRRAHSHSGSMRASPKRDLRRSSWRRITSRRRCRL